MPLKNTNKKNMKKIGKQSIAKSIVRKRSNRHLMNRSSRLGARRDPEFSKMTFVLNLDNNKSNQKNEQSKALTRLQMKNSLKELQNLSIKKSKQKIRNSSSIGILKNESDIWKRNSAPANLSDSSLSLRTNSSTSKLRLIEAESFEGLLNRNLDDNDEEIVVSARSFNELIRSAQRMHEASVAFMTQLRAFNDEISTQTGEGNNDDENSERLRREMERIQRSRDMIIAKNNIKRQDALKLSSERFDNMLKTQLNRISEARFAIQKGNSLPNITNLLHGRLSKTKLFEKLSKNILMKDETKEIKSNQCTALLPAYNNSMIFGNNNNSATLSLGSDNSLLNKKSNETLKKISNLTLFPKSISSNKSNSTQYNDSVSDYP